MRMVSEPSCLQNNICNTEVQLTAAFLVQPVQAQPSVILTSQNILNGMYRKWRLVLRDHLIKTQNGEVTFPRQLLPSICPPIPKMQVFSSPPPDCGSSSSLEKTQLYYHNLKTCAETPENQ